MPALVCGQEILPVGGLKVGDTVPIKLDRQFGRNETGKWSIASGPGELVGNTTSNQVSFRATDEGTVVIMLVIHDPNGDRQLTRRLEVQPNPLARPSSAVDSPPSQAAARPPMTPQQPARPVPTRASSVDIESLGSMIVSGWMGDAMAENDATALIDPAQTTGCRTGDQCYRVEYPKPGKLGWAAFAWQHVLDGPMNWGELPGVDLSERGFRSIRVWAKADPASGSQPRVQFKSGGNVAPKYVATNAASYSAAGPFVQLSTTYREFCLDLTGKKMNNVVSPFTIVLTRAANPKGAIVLLDDIQYSTAPCVP
jgi:hypothetical protein